LNITFAPCPPEGGTEQDKLWKKNKKENQKNQNRSVPPLGG